MKDRSGEAHRWYDEATSDVAFARVGLREGFYSKVCFLCQQAGEKALKALAYGDGERFVPGHSLQDLLVRLLPRHPSVEPLRDSCRVLDQYYVPTRYPNALPGGVPYRSYTEEQARQAISGCEQVMAAVHDELRRAGIIVE
ncbi:MAG TPA: HEPN domain-containing protein [archaeon]|nr:HEPN domain-containing protein [archaeon]